MRVPLEVLQIILQSAFRAYSRQQLLELRLVNCTSNTMIKLEH